MPTTAVFLNDKLRNCIKDILVLGLTNVSNKVFDDKEKPDIRFLTDSASGSLNIRLNLLLRNDDFQAEQRFPVLESMNNEILTALSWNGFSGPIMANVAMTPYNSRVVIFTVNIGSSFGVIGVMGEDGDTGDIVVRNLGQ